MIYGKAYDETDPISIERYAQGLIGKTFGQVCDEDDKKKGFMLVKEEVAPYGYAQKHENKKRKCHHECRDADEYVVSRPKSLFSFSHRIPTVLDDAKVVKIS